LSDRTGIRASIGVDVDPLDSHLAGYGLASTQRDTKAYDIAVPRLLDVFA
jgi:hypothetical protein